MYDVLIVGGGPAGLSAALVLGRCRRRVLVCDAGTPRNAASHAMHGFLTRDGMRPAEILRQGRDQLAKYDTVELRDVRVERVARRGATFAATLAGGAKVTARKVLIATGVFDDLPPIDGIEDYYGTSVHHCPYCDAWEWRDRPIAIYGRGKHGYGLALELTCWSRDLTLVTDGAPNLKEHDLKRLAANGIALRTEKVVGLEGTKGRLRAVVLADGGEVRCDAMFFNTGQRQQSRLAEALSCEYTSKGSVRTRKHARTCTAGVFAAGDASRNVQWVVIAAAEGAEAAFAINTELLQEDLK